MKNIGKVLVLSTGILTGAVLIPLSSVSVVEAAITFTVKINKVAYKATANLNMSSGAGTQYKVLVTIPKGKQVIATERAGSWYKVTYSYVYNGKQVSSTGWVTGTYITIVSRFSNTTTIPNVVKISKTSYQTNTNLVLRTGAGSNY
jgi:mannosyl-glycoprotein endo-beta-N-acetylglucosaminidase